MVLSTQKLQITKPAYCYSWHLWLARNRAIFDDKPVRWLHLIALIISAFNELPEPPQPQIRKPCEPPHIDKSTPWAFFDGAA